MFVNPRLAACRALCLVAAGLMAGCAAMKPNAADHRALYDGQPRAGLTVQIASSSDQRDLQAGAAEATVDEAGSKGRTTVRTSYKDGRRDALTLQWKGSWYAALRLTAARPMDLRPYLPDGTVDLDVDVLDMAQAGLTFAMGCGANCSSHVSYVLPSRALQGTGWQHVSIPLRCFARDGNDFSGVTQPFAVESSAGGEFALANVRIQRAGHPNVACVDYRLRSVTPEPLMETWSLDWWMPRFEAKQAAVRQIRASGVQPRVVFIGDSITERWETVGHAVWDDHYARYHALNLGFSGDRTENVLWRLEHGELDGLAPQVVVMMIGTNNTGARQEDPATTAAGVKRLVDEVRRRLPGAKLLLLAVFPRGATPTAPERLINDGINRRIAGLQDGRHVFFLDIGKDFTAPDGTLSKDIMPDLLHPNETGYRIWARSMQPTLQRLLSE